MSAPKKTEPVVATQNQINALFSKPFKDKADLTDAETKAMHEAELATGNAFYQQGKDVEERLEITTESTTFKKGVDKRATKSGGSKPKTEGALCKAFIAKQVKTWKLATVRKLRDACNERLGE